jgi:hypothetical protein
MSTTKGMCVWAVAVLLLASASIGRAAAQSTGSSRVPVTIALVERAPVPGAPFVILRRPNLSPRDVILLPRGADAAMFSEAVHMLVTARQVAGDTAPRAMTLRFRPNQARQQGHGILPWADRVLDDLHRAQPRQIEGVGRVLSVQIWLPAQRIRASRE